MAAVDQIEVLPPVPVGVEEGGAGAEGLHVIVFAAGAIVVAEVDSGFAGDLPIYHLSVNDADTPRAQANEQNVQSNTASHVNLPLVIRAVNFIWS